MKILILVSMLLSFNAMARSGQYYNTYSCKEKSFGYDFLLIHESKYFGINLNDEESKTYVFIRSLGKFMIDPAGTLPDNKGRQLLFRTDNQQEEGTIDMALMLKPALLSKKKGIQFATKFKGRMSLSVDNDHYKVNVVSDHITCKKI